MRHVPKSCLQGDVPAMHQHFHVGRALTGAELSRGEEQRRVWHVQGGHPR